MVFQSGITERPKLLYIGEKRDIDKIRRYRTQFLWLYPYALMVMQQLLTCFWAICLNVSLNRNIWSVYQIQVIFYTLFTLL